MARRPWIKLWVEDWDRSTALMTLEERGAYIRLITQQWSEGFIPSEPRRLALLLGVTPAHYDAELRDMVEAKFPLCEDGNRRNHRVEVERQAADDFHETQAAKGRISAHKRVNRGSNLVEPKSSRGSTGSQPSEKREERYTDRKKPAVTSSPLDDGSQELLVLQEPEPAGKEATAKTRHREDVRAVIDVYNAVWCERHRPEDGKAPPLSKADRGQAVALVKKYGAAGVISYVHRYLADDDAFVAGKRHPLALMTSRLRSYAGTTATTARAGPSPRIANPKLSDEDQQLAAVLSRIEAKSERA